MRVTTPMEGQVAGPEGVAPLSGSFIVRPDRPAAGRMRTISIVFGFILVPGNLLLALGSDGGWDLLLRLGSALMWTVLTLFQVRLWRRFTAADVLGEIGPSGIRINDLGRGWAALPWDAVGSVRKDWVGRIVVRAADGVDESTPGTEWPPRTTLYRRRPKKLFVMTRASDAAPNQVLAAITHYSGGRH